MHAREPAGPDDLPGRVAEHGLDGRALVGHAPAVVDDRDHVGGVLDQGAEAIVAALLGEGRGARGGHVGDRHGHGVRALLALADQRVRRDGDPGDARVRVLDRRSARRGTVGACAAPRASGARRAASASRPRAGAPSAGRAARCRRAAPRSAPGSAARSSWRTAPGPRRPASTMPTSIASTSASSPCSTVRLLGLPTRLVVSTSVMIVWSAPAPRTGMIRAPWLCSPMSKANSLSPSPASARRTASDSRSSGSRRSGRRRASASRAS